MNLHGSDFWKTGFLFKYFSQNNFLLFQDCRTHGLDYKNLFFLKFLNHYWGRYNTRNFSSLKDFSFLMFLPIDIFLIHIFYIYQTVFVYSCVQTSSNRRNHMLSGAMPANNSFPFVYTESYFLTARKNFILQNLKYIQV